MIQALVLAATMAMSPVQSGNDWRAIAFHDNWIKAIDASGVRATGSERIFWLSTYYREVQDDGTRYSVDRYKIECNRETISILHMTDYNDGGSSIFSGAGDSTDPIVPGSVAADYMAAVCHNDWPETTPVDSLKTFLQVARATFEDMAAEDAR
ncbi:surface-adhesin E family protein [Brevundimonas sp.]|jgi:hypothetical protein|uniref:surface-adhesin E family protein n=1 Tax=Brevundimonas sp. TaxID=1871086 RepID=UPI002EDB29E4